MSPKKSTSIKAAFMASPGPETPKDGMVLFLKGVCMGAADTVPGVSGGTIALITGIYEQLLAAIRSVDSTTITRFFRLDIKGAVAHLHTRFLFFLFAGISIAVISLARIMSHLLHVYPVYIWSLFFGLIIASTWAVGRKVDYRAVKTALMFLAGAIFAFALVGLVPASTPETLPFVFGSGMLAICAMILPGLSGAFILLILGKYEFIIGTLKNPFMPQNMIVIIVFTAGCAAGLAGFSRLLKYLLERHRPVVMAFLTGLMLGSLRRIWPWKEEMIISGLGEGVVMLRERNILPDPGVELVIPVALMIAGALAVICLERVSSSGEKAAIQK